MAAALVERLAKSEEIRHHELADGRHTVSYDELPRIFDGLDELFTSKQVTPSHCLALECAQSVAGALALLYLLSRGYHLVLLPQLGETSKEAGTPRFIPDFCSFVVTVLEGEPRQDGSDFPADHLRITANRAYIASPAVTDTGGADLYLRTSGSTSAPKMAKMSHEKWLANAMGCIDRWGLGAEDRLAVPVPIFHSYGFGAALLPGLLVGASMYFLSGFNIMRYLELEKSFEPNVAFLTPALCEMFLKIRKSSRKYKFSVTAGDKIKARTLADFETRFGPLLNLYGSAEMGAVSSPSPTDPLERRAATSGYPLPGIELRVEEGRLYCRQENGLAGYLIEDRDQWRFEPRSEDEWWATGDLAKIRDDGYLEIRGRSGLSVKRDGLLVVFADIETVMEQFDGLERVVVLSGGESRRGSRLLAACLARNAEKRPEISEIKKMCSLKLPVYSVPDEIVVLDSLPLLPSGKVNRRALKDLIS